MNTLQGSRREEDYRPNAGLAIFSREGLVFVGRRKGARGRHQWQMPQGGVDAGEATLDAAYRELEEETGLRSVHVDLLEEMKNWLYYDFPPELKARLGGPYLGQRQKWFAFRFKGAESDFNLELHEPEFDAWRWAPLADTPGMVIPFKQPVYEAVVQKFSAWTIPAQ